MNKFNVTLSALRKAGACVDGYNRLVRTLQGLEFTCDDAKRRNWLKFVHEDPVSIRTILTAAALTTRSGHCVASTTPTTTRTSDCSPSGARVKLNT